MINASPEWVKDAILNQTDKLTEIEKMSSEVKHFNSQGYSILKVSDRIYSLLYQRYFDNRYIYKNFQPEYPDEILGNLNGLPNWVSGSIGHGDQYFNSIHTDSEFIGIHEEFAKCKLTPSLWYGPRIYVTGSYLRMHIDKHQTHYVSSTITIETEIDQKFPLFLKERDRLIEVNLKSQEMLLYEGVRLPHFRPVPLSGKYYTSIFFHYKPTS